MTIISNNRISPAEVCSYVELRSIFMDARVADVTMKERELAITYMKPKEFIHFPHQIKTHTFTCPSTLDAERWKKLLDIKKSDAQQLNLAA